MPKVFLVNQRGKEPSTSSDPRQKAAMSSSPLSRRPSSDVLGSSEHSAFMRVTPSSSDDDKRSLCPSDEREPGEVHPIGPLPPFKLPMSPLHMPPLLRPFQLLPPPPPFPSPFLHPLPHRSWMDVHEKSHHDLYRELRGQQSLWNHSGRSVITPEQQAFNVQLQHSLDVYYEQLRELHSRGCAAKPLQKEEEAKTDDHQKEERAVKKMTIVSTAADSTDDVKSSKEEEEDKPREFKEEEEDDEDEDELDDEEEDEEHEERTKMPHMSAAFSPGLPFPPPPSLLSPMYPSNPGLLTGLHPPLQPTHSASTVPTAPGPLPGFLPMPGTTRRPRDPTKPPPVKKYKCDLCGKAFSRSNTLVTHRRIHTGEKPFKCEVCGRAFRQPGNLTRHRLTHTTVKPYVCPICKKAFNRASNLHTHMRTHANFKPFVCPFCGKGFQQKVDMKIHCYTHTGRPPV